MSTDNDVRQHVVHAIIQASRDGHDYAMQQLDRVITEYRPTSVESAAAAMVVSGYAQDSLDAARAVAPIEQSGASILDWQQVQVHALAAAYADLSRHWIPSDATSTIGDALKIMPAERAARVRRWLHRGGFLPDDDAAYDTSGLDAPSSDVDGCDGGDASS